MANTRLIHDKSIISIKTCKVQVLNGEYDVASAAYAVGYESSTLFSREYKRMFGESPLKDTHKKRMELC